MSAAKHTRGPWTLTHVSGSNFAVQEFHIKGPFGSTPNVYPIFNKNTSGIDDATVFVSPENARLMAAAPELLTLLQLADTEVGFRMSNSLIRRIHSVMEQVEGR